MKIQTKQIPYLLGALVLMVLGVSSCVAAKAHREAQDARTRAAAAESKAKVLAGEAQAADGKARLAAAQREAVALEVARLRRKLAETPLPDPPKPAPAEDAALAEALGLRGVMTPLPRIEAVTVWVWSEEALRVPQLTLRLDAAEDMVKAQDHEIGALKGEAEAQSTARDRWKAAHDAQADRGAALDSQVKAMAKEAKAKEVKWWTKMGAGVAASYLVGRATR